MYMYKVERISIFFVVLTAATIVYVRTRLSQAKADQIAGKMPAGNVRCPSHTMQGSIAIKFCSRPMYDVCSDFREKGLALQL